MEVVGVEVHGEAYAVEHVMLAGMYDESLALWSCEGFFVALGFGHFAGDGFEIFFAV